MDNQLCLDLADLAVHRRPGDRRDVIARLSKSGMDADLDLRCKLLAVLLTVAAGDDERSVRAAAAKAVAELAQATADRRSNPAVPAAGDTEPEPTPPTTPAPDPPAKRGPGRPRKEAVTAEHWRMIEEQERRTGMSRVDVCRGLGTASVSDAATAEDVLSRLRAAPAGGHADQGFLLPGDSLWTPPPNSGTPETKP